jgi:hypothetical protein
MIDALPSRIAGEMACHAKHHARSAGIGIGAASRGDIDGDRPQIGGNVTQIKPSSDATLCHGDGPA